MLWDLVDPRRPDFEKSSVVANLRSFGACLAQIHREPVAWPSEQRPRSYELIGEQELDDRRFAPLIDWLHAHRPRERSAAFVHGDFNVANVLFGRGRITGVVDWEFAGTGWREYEIAWSLRARTHFLRTESERNAVLEGYASVGTFAESQLRWCEVLNYLHFAFWNLDRDPGYATFFLRRAADLTAPGSA